MEQVVNLGHQQRLRALGVWYHLPVVLKKDPCTDLLAEGAGWVEESDPPYGMGQYTYFYRFVAEALWGVPGKDDRRKAAFRRFCRENSKQFIWIAEHRIPDSKDKNIHHLTQFRLGVFAPVLWVVSGPSQSKGTPGLAILSLRVRVIGIRRAPPIVATADRSEIAKTRFRQLTLADGMDALDYIRRTFARWRKDDLPGDALNAVFQDGGTVHSMPTKAEHDTFLAANGTPMVAPWVEALLAPIRINSEHADHFGDERAYMTSVVAVETPEGMTDIQAFRTIHDGAFFRLAEADRRGKGYAYQKPFLDTLRADYFYDRHAPDPDGYFGNTTRWITAPMHLCGIGTGRFMLTDAIPNCEKYYSLLQMLCVFEYYRLLQFSQRLSRLVEKKPKMNPPEFRKALLAIREDFLTFTHLHHFVNVTHQLQPAEMFTRLYHAMGLERLWREVEDELRSAAEYAAMEEQNEAAKRAERLNNLIAMGIPATLVVGALGMNILVADKFPAFFNHWFCTNDNQIFQVAVVTTVVLVGWFGLKRLVRGPRREAEGGWKLKAPVVVAGLVALSLAVVGIKKEYDHCAAKSFEATALPMPASATLPARTGLEIVQACDTTLEVRACSSPEGPK